MGLFLLPYPNIKYLRNVLLATMERACELVLARSEQVYQYQHKAIRLSIRSELSTAWYFVVPSLRYFSVCEPNRIDRWLTCGYIVWLGSQAT